MAPGPGNLRPSSSEGTTMPPITLAGMLATQEAALQAARTEVTAAEKRQADILDAANAAGRSALTDDEQRAFLAAGAEKRAAAARVAELEPQLEQLRADVAADEAATRAANQRTPGAPRPAYDEVARGLKEPRTYTKRGSDQGTASFFSDAYRSEKLSDFAARDRLQRHAREVEVEREYRARDNGPDYQERATTTTSYGSLVVPQYLVDLFAPALRFARPTANLCQHHELPEGGMSLLVPRGTTAAAAAIQATQNSSVQNTDEAITDLTIPVVTVAGQQDISRQALERGTPGIDSIVYGDLARSYHQVLDVQVLTGSGTSGQMLGIQNTSGIGAATAFGAAPTTTLLNSKIAGQIAAVGSVGAGLYPRVMIVHPRRWGWLLAQVDSQGRPIVVAESAGAVNAWATNKAPFGAQGMDYAEKTDSDVTSGYLIVGTHSSGLPVVTDANMPTTVGTNVEDLIFVSDPTEYHLWEAGDGMPRELRFEQTLGNQLTTKLVVYGYSAFTAGRYPGATGKIGGLDATATWGLVAPTF